MTRAALLPVLLLAGCATMFSGTSQKLTVTTVPPGAGCTLLRDGFPIGTIIATPGTLEVAKGSGHLKITCAKAGYLDAVVTAVSHYNTSTLWNGAGFGIIGLGVDAGTGAMYHYVPEVTIQMIAEEFDSEASRDATFYGIARITEVEAKGARETLSRSCRSDCEESLRSFDASLAQRLADLDRKRLAAKVKK
jgi:hypothetical protein